MKFLFYHPGIYVYASKNPKAIGGAERQQWLIAKALATRGQEVVVYGLTGEKRSSEVIQDVEFKWLHDLHVVQAWQWILKHENVDWWYCRGADYYLGVVSLLARLHKTKSIYACAFDLDCFPLKALTRRKYLWPSYAAGLFATDRIFVQHDGQRRAFTRLLKPKARLVSNIADPISETCARSDYVAWVGVLRQPKRPHLLVEIANKLPEIQFVVCGPPSLHRTSQQYAGSIVQKFENCPNIDYRGQVSPEEAQDVIRNAAFLISTSQQEGFPNTMLQAWGAGVPVIALVLDPGGVIVRHSLGVVTKNTDELAALLPGLLADETQSKQWSINCQRYTDECHSERVVMNQFYKALEVD